MRRCRPADARAIRLALGRGPGTSVRLDFAAASAPGYWTSLAISRCAAAIASYSAAAVS
jgi:hypothetical protein